MADKIIPPRRDELLTNVGRGTVRFSDYLERIAKQTNSNSSDLEATTTPNIFAALFSLEERIGSGDQLTSDETGFTVDLIKLTVDMTEA